MMRVARLRRAPLLPAPSRIELHSIHAKRLRRRRLISSVLLKCKPVRRLPDRFNRLVGIPAQEKNLCRNANDRTLARARLVQSGARGGRLEMRAGDRSRLFKDRDALDEVAKLPHVPIPESPRKPLESFVAENNLRGGSSSERRNELGNVLRSLCK